VIDNGNLAFNRSDPVTFPGIVSGTGSLNQNGLGTLILTGSSNYTGATAVSAGTLQVNGVLGTTAVTVQSGATLAGQGTIGGSVTIQDGGHLAPGATAQTLGVGSLLLNPASKRDRERRGVRSMDTRSHNLCQLRRAARGGETTIQML